MTGKRRRVRYEVRPTPKAKRAAGEHAWTVSRDGDAIAVLETQDAAIAHATLVARCAWAHRGQLGEVIIKGRDGKIRDTRTYGADPNPPKG